MEAIVWVPIMVAFRSTIETWGDRGIGKRLVEAIGPPMMSVYVWHQPALAIVVASIAALNLELPDQVGWLWLATKIPWFAACLGVLWVLLKVVSPSNPFHRRGGS